MEVRHAYQDAVLCGYLRPADAPTFLGGGDGGGSLETATHTRRDKDTVHLNPVEDDVLRAGDKLVLLSQTGVAVGSIQSSTHMYVLVSCSALMVLVLCCPALSHRPAI